MKIGTLFITCLKALVRNPMRAALTVLGIVIGIAAVVAIMEIGEGSKKQVADKFSSMGTNVITISGASGDGTYSDSVAIYGSNDSCYMGSVSRLAFCFPIDGSVRASACVEVVSMDIVDVSVPVIVDTVSRNFGFTREKSSPPIARSISLSLAISMYSGVVFGSIGSGALNPAFAASTALFVISSASRFEIYPSSNARPYREKTCSVLCSGVSSAFCMILSSAGLVKIPAITPPFSGPIER